MATNFVENDDESERYWKTLWGITLWHLFLYCVLIMKESVLEEVVFSTIVENIFTKIFIGYILWYGWLVFFTSIFVFFFYLIGGLKKFWRREIAKDVKQFCICLVGTVLNACFCVAHAYMLGRMC